jgi:hypothetical protein
MNVSQKVLGSLSLVGLFVFGCGGTKSTGTGSAAPVSQMVTAASGGEVKVGSTASLNIPASSLGADTTITAMMSTPDTTLPDQSTLKGQYFDFGPDGTTFNPPATLTLPSPGTAPANSKAVISWYDGTKWNDLDTTSAGGMLSAPVAHFTGFVVRWVVTGTSTAKVDCTMPAAPCGGDVVGTWKPAGACLPPQMVGNCTDTSAVTYEVMIMGSATFNADLTYSADLPVAVTGKVHATPACISSSGFASCADTQAKLRTAKDSHFSTLWANATCTGDAASAGCDCTGSTTDSITSNETGTYAISGNMYTTTKTGQTAGSSTGYCVSNGELWIQTKSSPAEYLVFGK